MSETNLNIVAGLHSATLLIKISGHRSFPVITLNKFKFSSVKKFLMTF